MSGQDWLFNAEFVGSSAGDELAFGNNGVSMTDDGSLLAAGSISASTNGIVQVFKAIATPSPSQAPVASPPPLAPSNNLMSSSAILIPVNPDQFQWDILRLGSAQVDFILTYNIAFATIRFESIRRTASLRCRPM